MEEMAKLLGYPLDTIFSLHTDDKMGDPLNGGSNSLPTPIPGPLTLQTALSRYADLLTPPKKVYVFLKQMDKYCFPINLILSVMLADSYRQTDKVLLPLAWK